MHILKQYIVVRRSGVVVVVVCNYLKCLRATAVAGQEEQEEVGTGKGKHRTHAAAELCGAYADGDVCGGMERTSASALFSWLSINAMHVARERETQRS